LNQTAAHADKGRDSVSELYCGLIFANYFETHPNNFSLYIGTLKKIQSEICEKLSIYINITRDAIDSDVDYRSGLFVYNKEEGCIERGDEATYTYFLRIGELYNWQLPEEVKEEFRNIIMSN